MKKLIVALPLIAAAAAPAGAKDRMTHDPAATNEQIIMHAWSWNFPTIAENMKQIADAG